LPEPPEDIQVDRLPLLRGSLPAPIAALFDALESRHPQYGVDWLRNLSRHALDPGEEAVLFLARGPRGQLAALPLKIAGRRGHALGNFYTSLYSPAISAGAEQELLPALFRHLARHERLALLTLDPLDPDTALFHALPGALRAAGWHGIHDYFCFGNWQHPLDGANWEAYLASRASRVRNTVKRRSRRFAAEARGTMRMVLDGAELETAIDEFTAIYNNSWKRREPYPDFIPELLRLSARRGWLRLGIAYYDERPVAAQAWLVDATTAYIFKLAYDQDFAELSPGTVLTAYMMEYAIDVDRVSRIDYLSGDDRYKRDWMSERQERRGIAAYNPRTPAGIAGWASHLVKSAAKKLRKPRASELSSQ